MSLNFRREIGEAFAKARRNAGMTQQGLARHAKTRQANISRLERGIQNPSLDFLSRVAKVLGLDVQVTLK